MSRSWCHAQVAYTRFAVGALLAIGITCAQPQTARSQTALIGVTVVDPGTATLRIGQTVLVAGDTIVAVGPDGEVLIPAQSRRIPAQGKYLIPGLWDAHTHLSSAGREVLGLMLSYGVTAVRDMGGGPDVLGWRDSVSRGELVGPRIRSAGRIVESARWINAVRESFRRDGRLEAARFLDERFAVASADDAVEAVDSLVRLGADFIKIRNYPGPDAYLALARRAREVGLPIVGHAPPVSFLGTVSDSGFASIEHVIIEFRGNGAREALTAMTPDDRAALTARMARNHTAFTPTLRSGAARLVPDSALARMISDSTGATDPHLRLLPQRLRNGWRRQLEERAGGQADPIDWAAIQQDTYLATRQLAEAGVKIVAGTDFGVPTLIPGASLHDELESLVRDVGLSPAEALVAATANAAEVAGIPGHSGRIAPGHWADLVLLNTNPLADIAAVRNIHAVVAAGRYLDQTALKALLDR